MRHRFERILDVLGEAVIVRDADSRLVYANEAAAQLFAVESPAELYASSSGAEIFGRVEMIHPDGTPVDLDELPYRRLLAGPRRARRCSCAWTSAGC